MVTLSEVEQQLKDIGANFSFWGRAEMKELQHVLIPGEIIQGCLNGRYERGFAMLCATDHRLLLIDKKLFQLSVEDLRYDMITEVDYGAQLLSGTVKISTPTKALVFSSFKPKQLRVLVHFIQQRVIEIRQQFAYQHQPAQQVMEPKPLVPQAPLIDPNIEAYQRQPALEPKPAIKPLPLSSRNPYATAPLMMRHRIGRFGRVATDPAS